MGRLVVARDGGDTYRVSAATLEKSDERSPDRLKVDYSRAFAAEMRLRETGKDVPIGAWHSHPHGDDGLAAMDVQITRRDKASTVDGAVEMICATCSDPNAMPRKPVDFLLARKVGGVVCRIEAWLRRKRRFLPCELVRELEAK